MLIKKIWDRVQSEYRTFFYKNISYLLSSFFKTDNRIMLFGSMNGKLIDNTKYLYFYVLKEKKSEYYPYWITEHMDTFHQMKKAGNPVVYKWSIDCMLLVLKAKYFFVTHSQANIFPYKTQTTMLINLWHGSPLKKMGYDSLVDRNNKRTKSYQDWDYLIVAHEKFIPFFQSALRIKKEKILPVGLPRNNILWQSKIYKDVLKDKISSQYDFDSNRKIILYAPTFRDTKTSKELFHKEVYEFIEKFSQQNQQEYVLLLRLHPFDQLLIDLNKYSCVLDCSDYDDMQELMIVSDVLITDYSSCMFDFSIMQKRILLFLFDNDDYSKSRSGLYFNIDELPFEKVYSCDLLVKSIFSSSRITIDYDKEIFNKENSLDELLLSII